MNNNLSVREFGEKYKGMLVTDGTTEGIIVGYDTNCFENLSILVKYSADGGTDAKGYRQGVEIMLPWEGCVGARWVDKRRLKLVKPKTKLIPTLKPGMLVTKDGVEWFICMPVVPNSAKGEHGGVLVCNKLGQDIGIPSLADIIEVRNITSFCHYGVFFRNKVSSTNTVSLWKKETPKTESELKMEELAKTIADAQLQLKELQELGDK